MESTPPLTAMPTLSVRRYFLGQNSISESDNVGAARLTALAVILASHVARIGKIGSADFPS